MNRKSILILFALTTLLSCNSYIPPKDIFNHHLTRQLAYELSNKPGVKEIDEEHNSTSISDVIRLTPLLPVKFSPNMDYTYVYYENGFIKSSYINKHKDYTIRYEYDRMKKLLSIAGYKPDYVKEIFEYHKDGYIKYIFREKGEDIIYKYTEDHKTISCFTFRPIKDGNKRALRTEKLVAQIQLKSYEDGSFVVQVNDASNGKEIEKYTYEELNLVQKKDKNGKTIIYEYDDYDNILKITCVLPEKETLNYIFDYSYDNNDNWTDRQIMLDDKVILKTDRTIKYY